jgi:hypothetical protein
MSLARLHYNHNHPGVGDEQAEPYPRNKWREWVHTALQAGRCTGLRVWMLRSTTALKALAAERESRNVRRET